MTDKKQRLVEIREELNRLGVELLSLTAPTEEEIKELVVDAEINPEIYMSYLVDDPIFICENILDNRECDEETEVQDGTKVSEN